MFRDSCKNEKEKVSFRCMHCFIFDIGGGEVRIGGVVVALFVHPWTAAAKGTWRHHQWTVAGLELTWELMLLPLTAEVDLQIADDQVWKNTEVVVVHLARKRVEEVAKETFDVRADDSNENLVAEAVSWGGVLHFLVMEHAR
jgi:hypothetical protein